MERTTTEPTRAEEGRAKRVRISPLSQTIPLGPTSDEDVRNSWYTRHEVARFKRSVRRRSKSLSETRTARAMGHIAHSAATGSLQSDVRIRGSESILGIEHLISPEVDGFILQNRACHALRVLAAQELQRRAGERDPEPRIAREAALSSSFSREWCRRIVRLQYHS